MSRFIARLVRDEQGQDLIEYVLIGSFVSIGALAGATALGQPQRLVHRGGGVGPGRVGERSLKRGVADTGPGADANAAARAQLRTFYDAGAQSLVR